jgi:hypothetical protein
MNLFPTESQFSWDSKPKNIWAILAVRPLFTAPVKLHLEMTLRRSHMVKDEDLQTTLRLYSVCTANKITHLFSHDVYNTTLDELPDQHWFWNSDLTDKFSTMAADLIANIANQSSLPIYSQLIANISIQEGGLGIQSPRTNAITSHMTTTKHAYNMPNKVYG